MGASVSPRGGKKRRLNAEMNVVPYIDVMLVLLIIFMVTAPLLTQGIDVELPEADAANITQGEEPITLSVSRDGQLFLNVGENRSSALSDEEVVQQAGAIARNKPQEMFLVEGDAKVPYESVARGMSLLQTAGVKKIGFVTSPVAPTTKKKR
ncbi:MAG: biopolymer transport protein TolR [Hydrocarboniphaga sp.]|uniref:protein TolR n=1 Tax=Hydrocarboniphaga sp. TaxID=2033016 RepID=UPI00262B1267|nr:protein TolR [Hydrocarboniphaga sp.]MDB5971810.1 biopolymer transport protein TolR [Hydrocarboniphaga sp.]